MCRASWFFQLLVCLPDLILVLLIWFLRFWYSCYFQLCLTRRFQFQILPSGSLFAPCLNLIKTKWLILKNTNYQIHFIQKKKKEKNKKYYFLQMFRAYQQCKTRWKTFLIQQWHYYIFSCLPTKTASFFARAHLFGLSYFVPASVKNNYFYSNTRQDLA